MKKVLFVAHVEIHILHFHVPYLKLFKEHGYEVHVATNGESNIPYCDVKYNLPFQKSPLKKDNYTAYKRLKEILNKENFEIIHCHTPVGGVVARLANKFSNHYKTTRMIYTAHGFHFYKGAPMLYWMIFFPIERWMAHYTDILITINQEDYDRAKKFHLKKDGVVEYVHGVGVDEKKFNFYMSEDEKIKLRKSLGLSKDDFVMIFPAELNKNKNQKQIINLVNELVKKEKKIKLLLPGNDLLHGEYQNEIKKLNLENNIKVLGYRNDIAKLIKISDIGISSCIREGLGLNLIEEMYCGLPVIASNNRGHREIVKNNVNGYLYELNSDESLLDKILLLFSCKEKFEKDEIKRSIDKFLVKNVIEEYKCIYFDRGDK